MRTLLVTHYFPPEIGAPQARLAELAANWARDGDDVTVLTGMPNHPTGIIPPEYRGVIRRREERDGVDVVRTWLYATPNEGVAKKTAGHLSFMVTSFVLGGITVGRPDVVVVSSPTFFSILSAWALARVKRAHLVVEIRDLWPAIFVELGVLTNPTIIRALESIELASYRAADAVVVVSDGFRDNLIERGVPADKVFTIRNGVDLERFAPDGHAPDSVLRARERLGASPNDTLVLYIGAHGISHGLTAIADAAAQLTGTDIHVAFVGEGAAKRDLIDRVRELGITNVTTLPGVPRDEVADLLAAADICLVPLRDVPLFSTFIPSKLFEYLGAGKAVIGSVRGEPATILREAGAIVVEPEDVAGIAAAITELSADPDRRQAMGEAGRRYVEANFDRRALARDYREILTRIVEPDDDDVVGTVATSRDLVRFVWTHPENAAGGVRGRVRGLSRMVAWQVWQRTVKRSVTVRMPGGLRLRVHPHSTAASGVVYSGLPEWEDMRFVLEYLEAGDTFVDVGANVGVFSLLAASNAAVDVTAYEPSTAAFARLQENHDLNMLGDRMRLRNAAVGDRQGTVHLTAGLDTINRVLAGDDSAEDHEEVELTTLDDDLPALDSVALVKIDVEGFEPQVLAGATKLLETARPALIVEANDRPRLQQLLAAAGYRAYRYHPSTRTFDDVGWDFSRGNNILALADCADAERRVRRS